METFRDDGLADAGDSVEFDGTVAGVDGVEAVLGDVEAAEAEDGACSC